MILAIIPRILGRVLSHNKSLTCYDVTRDHVAATETAPRITLPMLPLHGLARISPRKEQMIWRFGKAGNFNFVCLQIGHPGTGMIGKITVTKDWT